jgi:SAM-dependent methyltransferase
MARLVPLERRWNHNFHHHDLLLEAMPSPCRAALDVGCGDGTFLAKLAPRAGRVTGIDRAPLVDEGVRAAAPAAEWIAADFLAHDFGERKFDFVACVATLHQMEFAPAVGKMASLLEPGGVLAIVGLANSTTARDVAFDAMGLARSRLERVHRRFHRVDAAQTDCRMTYGEVERAAAALLPGATSRRLVLFRYWVTWRKPPGDPSLRPAGTRSE